MGKICWVWQELFGTKQCWLDHQRIFWKWFFDSILFYSIILLYYFFLLFDNPAANLQSFLRGQPYSSSVSHCIYQLWTWRSPGTMTLKMAFVIYIFLGIFLKTHNTFFTEHLWTQFVLSTIWKLLPCWGMD